MNNNIEEVKFILLQYSALGNIQKIIAIIKEYVNNCILQLH